MARQRQKRKKELGRRHVGGVSKYETAKRTRERGLSRLSTWACAEPGEGAASCSVPLGLSVLVQNTFSGNVLANGNPLPQEPKLMKGTL